MRKFLALCVLLVACTTYAQQRPMVGPVTIQSPTAAIAPLTIQGASGQSSDLLQVKTAAGVTKTVVNAAGDVNYTFKLTGATPLSFVYSDLSGQLKSASPFSINPLNNYVGVNVASPTAPFHVNASTLFSDDVAITDGGFGAVTFGQYRPTQGVINWNEARLRFGFPFGSKGTTVAGSANEWGLHIASTTLLTASGAPYEKGGLFVYSESMDPSNYGASITRDVVGADIRGVIVGGISNGRVWGINPWASIQAGSDGSMVGGEVDIDNNGSDQPEVDSTTSKSGFNIVSLGASAPTNAFGIISSGAGNKFHKGLWSSQAYLSDSFLELDGVATHLDVWRVKNTGQTLIGALQNNATLNDYDPTVYGALAVLNYMTVPASTSEKNALYLLSDASITTHRIGTTRYDNSVAFWPLALDTAGNQVMKLTIDPIVQLTTSYAGGNLSAAGTVALRNHGGVLEASQNAGAWTAIGAGESTPDCTEASPVVKCLVSSNAATYLQVENDTNGTAAQAILVAQSGNGGTLNILAGATSASFTTTNGIPALAGYISSGTGASAGIYQQTRSGAIHYLVGGVSENFRLDAGGSLLVFGSGQGVVFNFNGGAANESSITGTSNSISGFAQATYGGAGTEVFRFNSNLTDGTCIRINGALRRLTLSAGAVIDGGAC